jgi:very-short-patch-repair endonuclease
LGAGGAGIERGVIHGVQAQLATRSADRIIATLARRQHNCVSCTQLIEHGITRQEIGTRLNDGRLTEIHRGVYLAGPLPSEHTYAQAALLAVKGDVALSHFSAACIWRLRQLPPIEPWVTTPRQAARPGIRIHRATLEAVDLRTRLGMRVTSPPRTVLDCAALYEDDYEYEALVAEAGFRRLAGDTELRGQIERNPGKRGMARLKRVLDLPGGPRRTLSAGERAFLRLLREEGFEGYDTNSKVFGPRLDFVWPELDFAVEVDGWDGHSERIAFERDRLKIAKLAARGIQVMPITGRQIKCDRRGVVNRLNGALKERSINRV